MSVETRLIDRPIAIAKNVSCETSGEGVVVSLQRFNGWIDDFLIQLSRPLLLIGFIMGTVDVMLQTNVSRETWFNVSWAVVQAVAVDSLFFGTWGKVFHMFHVKHVKHAVKHLVAGVLLAGVAYVSNETVTFQAMTGETTLVSLKHIGVSPETFVSARGLLVVACAILVSSFVSSETQDVSRTLVNDVVVGSNEGNETRRTYRETSTLVTDETPSVSHETPIATNVSRETQEQLTIVSCETQPVSRATEWRRRKKAKETN